MVSYSRSRVSRAQVARLAQLDHFLERAEQDKKSLAATMTGIGEPIISELREEGSAFEHRIKKIVCDSLEQKSLLLAYEGVIEPVVVEGKVARDDDGNPMGLRRYSDSLLLALLRAENPERFALPLTMIHSGWLRWLAWASLAFLAIWVMGDLSLRFLALTAG